jgi:hypothetical protein
MASVPSMHIINPVSGPSTAQQHQFTISGTNLNHTHSLSLIPGGQGQPIPAAFTSTASQLVVTINRQLPHGRYRVKLLRDIGGGLLAPNVENEILRPIHYDVLDAQKAVTRSEGSRLETDNNSYECI